MFNIMQTNCITSKLGFGHGRTELCLYINEIKQISHWHLNVSTSVIMSSDHERFVFLHAECLIKALVCSVSRLSYVCRTLCTKAPFRKQLLWLDGQKCVTRGLVCECSALDECTVCVWGCHGMLITRSSGHQMPLETKHLYYCKYYIQKKKKSFLFLPYFQQSNWGFKKFFTSMITVPIIVLHTQLYSQ